MTALAAAVVAALLGATYLDINSTQQFLKRGTGYEDGWFGLMAWLQRVFPRAWPWLKAAVAAALAAAAFLLLPVKFAIAAIAILALVTFIAALANYQLSK